MGLNRMRKNYLKIPLMIYLGLKQMVVIYQLTSQKRVRSFFRTLHYVCPGEEILWKGTVSAEIWANRRKLCYFAKFPNQEIR